MPNSTAAAKAALLGALGLSSTEPLFGQIPASHRFTGDLGQPPALSSELALVRHLDGLLARNQPAAGRPSFLGGGIWHHHVPAVVDEIVGRAEFLTNVWGTPSSDFGRNQAWWEFTSQLGALLEMELVSLPVYSWGCALGHAARMALRLTGRQVLLVPASMCPQRRAVLDGYAASVDPAARLHVETIPCDATGRLDLAALTARLGPDVAAVYYENPTYLGGLEANAAAIAQLARAAGAETIAGGDPSCLGLIAPPGALGVDIAVGTIQPLGIHMHAGGGLGGYIASRDEARYAAEYPTLLNSITETVDGRPAFGLMLFHQSSYGSRELGKDWTGNSTYLWAIGAAVYMALLGPEGFAELGRLIMARTAELAAALADVPGVAVIGDGPRWKEVVVDVSGTGRDVASIHAALLARGILGGITLSPTRALYAATEMTTPEDIAALAAALREIVA